MRSPRLPATLALLSAFAIASAPPALADPADPTPAPSGPSQQQVDRARAAVDAAAEAQQRLERELQSAQDELDRVNDSAQLATENYNEARVLLAQRTAAATKARKHVAATQRTAAAEKHRVDDLAATLYMQGGSLEQFEVLLGLTAGSDMARNAADMDAVSGYRASTLATARDSAAKAQAAQRVAAQAQLQQRAAAATSKAAFEKATKAVADAERRSTALEARRAAGIQALARLRHTSAQVERTRLDGLARQRAERTALDRADGAATSARTDLPVADNDAARSAIGYAQQQLGKPYRWGAEGPGSFDCSGLTMRAWQVGGRSLLHYTGSQYEQTSQVPLADLVPGDLVFFGSSESAIHHVGLYVGNGTMIEAPRTGLSVRYSSIYRPSLLPHGGRP